jgi:hypothetical protein
MRKKLNVLVSLILSLVGLMAIARTASANRWASLQQNQLIEDKENVYLYPQLLLDYRNSIGFDYGSGGSETATGENGQVNTGRVLYLGGWKNFGLGMSARYGSISPAFSAPIPNDLLSQETSALFLGENSSTNPFTLYSLGPLIGTVSVNGETVAVAPPFGVVDAFVALPTGIGAFGVRLGVATRAEYAKSGDQEVGNDETLLTLQAGLSGKGDVRWDTSLNLAFDFYTNKNETTDEKTSSGLVRASLSGRGYVPIGNKVDLGIVGNLVFSRSSTSVDSNSDKAKGNGLGIGVMGGLGPVFRINENVIVAGYGLLGISLAEQDDVSKDNAKDTTSDLLIFIPALRIAADIGITDWFFFRSGIQYSFQMARSSLGKDIQLDADSYSRRNGKLGLSAGIGFKTTGGFTIDGTLSSGFLTTGPDFIGGSPQTLFGVVSAGYHWL